MGILGKIADVIVKLIFGYLLFYIIFFAGLGLVLAYYAGRI